MLHDSNWLILILLLGMGGLIFLGLVRDTKNDRAPSSTDLPFSNGDDQ